MKTRREKLGIWRLCQSLATLPNAEPLRRATTDAWAALTTSSTNKQLSKAAQAAQGRAGNRHGRQPRELPPARGHTGFLLKATGLQYNPHGHPAGDVSSGWRGNAPARRGRGAAASAEPLSPLRAAGTWAAHPSQTPPSAQRPTE